MKLYHATTVYHLLNAIAHVQKYGTFGEDDILLAPWLKTKISDLDILKIFFSEYYFYDADLNRIPEEKLEEEINKNINRFCNKNNLQLTKYDEIVVGGAQYNFGIYLCNNNIEFSAIEESCGILSRPEVVENIDANFTVARAAIAKRLEIFRATHSAITRVYCDVDSQKEGFECDKMVDFKVLEVLKSMEEEKIKCLLKMFGVTEKISVNQNSAFLLTQQFAGLKLMSFDDQVFIYQLFCDFFLKGQSIIIKPHPDDPCYYSQIITDAEIIKGKFPSELTPFVFEKMPQTLATISSTGINPLKPLFDNIIQLDFKYESEFKKTLKYYVALKVISNMEIHKCKLFGGNQTLLRQLVVAEKMQLDIEDIDELSNLEYSEDTAIVIDECSHENKDIANIFDLDFASYIFLNTDGTYGFYRSELSSIYNNIVPVIVRKNIIRDDEVYISEEDEVIFVYSNNKENNDKMKETQLEETLKNTGVTFKIAELSAEQLEIERLKGILAATEKRLLYYINLEKEGKI